MCSPAAGRTECTPPGARQLNRLASKYVPWEQDCLDTPEGKELAPSRAELAQIIPPPLRRSGDLVSQWAVGVTTAPRAEPTLEECLTSLASAGWDNPRLFVDGAVSIPDAFDGLCPHRAQYLSSAPGRAITSPWPSCSCASPTAMRSCSCRMMLSLPRNLTCEPTSSKFSGRARRRDSSRSYARGHTLSRSRAGTRSRTTGSGERRRLCSRETPHRNSSPTRPCSAPLRKPRAKPAGRYRLVRRPVGVAAQAADLLPDAQPCAAHRPDQLTLGRPARLGIPPRVLGREQKRK